jgi:hypothetical protein
MLQTWGAWGPSWWCSLLLFAVTIAFHAFGVVYISRGLEGLRAHFPGAVRRLDTAQGAVAVIVLVALLLAMMHAIEALIWASVYVLLGAIPTPADAVLYSVDSFTTRGASGLTLAPGWRLMGAAEAGDGMLLFGISTAFLFYVMQRNWKIIAHIDTPKA